MKFNPNSNSDISKNTLSRIDKNKEVNVIIKTIKLQFFGKFDYFLYLDGEESFDFEYKSNII